MTLDAASQKVTDLVGGGKRNMRNQNVKNFLIGTIELHS